MWIMVRKAVLRHIHWSWSRETTLHGIWWQKCSISALLTHPQCTEVPWDWPAFLLKPNQTMKNTSSIWIFLGTSGMAVSYTPHITKQKTHRGFNRLGRSPWWGPAENIDAQNGGSGASGQAVPCHLLSSGGREEEKPRAPTAAEVLGEIRGNALRFGAGQTRRSTADSDSIGHNECTGSATGRHFSHPSPCSHMVQ